MDDGDHPWVMAAEAHIGGSPWILWNAGWVEPGVRGMMDNGYHHPLFP